ncbi:hypothetical protein RhiirA4_406616 [Rhizophagus irregularis]|uniref:Uncharacterized protein n=1 Tax=Rhizophagus irregularis TaxID=588596 RepID=A0A2I1GV69_9GLOM|nr:hypothetical protein RhiirA4_406616 [Rhizophagus irregularis]
MWFRTDESMIFGGHNLKEALENYLFIKKIFATLKITSMNLYNEKKADKWYEKNEKTSDR